MKNHMSITVSSMSMLGCHLGFWGCASSNSQVNYYELTQAAAQASYHENTMDQQELGRLYERWWSYMIARNPRLAGLYELGYRGVQADDLIIKWPMNLWATCRLDDRIAVLVHDGGRFSTSGECFVLETDSEGRLLQIWQTQTGGSVILQSAELIYQRIPREENPSYVLTGDVVLCYGGSLTLWRFAVDDKHAITTGIYEIDGERHRYFRSREGYRRPSFIGDSRGEERTDFDPAFYFHDFNEYYSGQSTEDDSDPYTCLDRPDPWPTEGEDLDAELETWPGK